MPMAWPSSYQRKVFGLMQAFMDGAKNRQETIAAVAGFFSDVGGWCLFEEHYGRRSRTVMCACGAASGVADDSELRISREA